MTVAAFHRVCRIGQTPGWNPRGTEALLDVWVEIDWDGDRLSITGVEGPRSNGDAWGSCGQIQDVLKETILNGWDVAEIARLHEIWEDWHLNDMKAGTPKQMAHLKAHRGEYSGYPQSHYDWAKECLTRANLQPDPETGYSYGSAWLRVEVPVDVLEWLAALPETPGCPWPSMLNERSSP